MRIQNISSICLFYKDGEGCGGCKLSKKQYSVIRWYRWRTRQDLNLLPTDYKSDVVGKQGETATNKDNNINKMIVLHYCHISQNVACFCKLMAQNWHKNFALVRACSDFFVRSIT